MQPKIAQINRISQPDGWISMRSPGISAVRFTVTNHSDGTGTLRIRFQPPVKVTQTNLSTTYDYFGVPESEFQHMLNATSPATYFNSSIKPAFGFRRLTKDELELERFVQERRPEITQPYVRDNKDKELEDEFEAGLSFESSSPRIFRKEAQIAFGKHAEDLKNFLSSQGERIYKYAELTFSLNERFDDYLVTIVRKVVGSDAENSRYEKEYKNLSVAILHMKDKLERYCRVNPLSPDPAAENEYNRISCLHRGDYFYMIDGGLGSNGYVITRSLSINPVTRTQKLPGIAFSLMSDAQEYLCSTKMFEQFGFSGNFRGSDDAFGGPIEANPNDFRIPKRLEPEEEEFEPDLYDIDVI